jgi:DNA repair exonuclease SbcCD ATPase subunit
MNRVIPPKETKMQKSVIDEIRQLKAQVQSKTEQAKAEALESGREAINFLRELGIDNDTILKELGFRARTKSPKEKAERTSSEDQPCPICGFRTDPPHDGRSHRGQSKKKPLTTEELEEKGLTKL